MKVIVVGGGYAGIAAAVDLADAGHRVTLHESRSALGGRAGSLPPPPGFPCPLDNGPHLGLGAYSETLRLFERLRIPPAFRWVSPLELTWRLKGGETVTLRASRLPAPLHLAFGLLFSDAFHPSEKYALASSVFRLAFTRSAEGTVADFTTASGQGPSAKDLFWGPLTRAILNVQPDRAPLKGLSGVFRRAFFASRGDSDLAIPQRPLGEIFGDRVDRYLSARDGAVRLKSGVARIEWDGARLRGFTSSGEPLEADAWVFAVPPDRLAALFPDQAWAQGLPRLGKSPIVTAHLYLSHPVMEKHLVGFPDSEFEWAFNRNANWGLRFPGQVVSLVSSAEPSLAARSESDLITSAFTLLRERLPEARKCELRAGRVTREPAATFDWTLESDALRPGPVTPLFGVYLAGDWTATGLPATLEGAVFSGLRAAICVRDLFHKTTRNS